MADGVGTEALKAFEEVLGGITTANGYNHDITVSRDLPGDQTPGHLEGFIYPEPQKSSFRVDLDEKGMPLDQSLIERVYRFGFMVYFRVPDRPRSGATARTPVDDDMLDVVAMVERRLGENRCLKTDDYPDGAVNLVWVGDHASMPDENPPFVVMELLAYTVYTVTGSIDLSTP